MPQPRDESGAVTAETAAVIPVLVLVAALLAWMVAFGVTEVRAIDAARETARALARGDEPGSSREVGQRIAPTGSTFSVRHEGNSVVVTVEADVPGPGSLFGSVLGQRVRAEAVAEVEPGS